jgi:hypothetical protein
MSTNNSWVDSPWRNLAIVFEELPESLILDDLKRSWDFQREAHFRCMQKVVWTSKDCYRVVLRDVEGMVGDIIKEMCDKPTTLYWLQSAQSGAPHAHEKSCMSGGIFAAIFEAWHRSSVHPNIEFGHFFAAPVRITATGPLSIPQILRHIHRSAPKHSTSRWICTTTRCIRFFQPLSLYATESQALNLDRIFTSVFAK